MIPFHFSYLILMHSARDNRSLRFGDKTQKYHIRSYGFIAHLAYFDIEIKENLLITDRLHQQIP